MLTTNAIKIFYEIAIVIIIYYVLYFIVLIKK